MESETETRRHSTKAKYAHILDASHENLYNEKEMSFILATKEVHCPHQRCQKQLPPQPLIIYEPQRGDDHSNCTVEVNNSVASAHRFDGNEYLLLFKRLRHPFELLKIPYFNVWLYFGTWRFGNGLPMSEFLEP